jgi:dihydrolipoamide dehydrogenase
LGVALDEHGMPDVDPTTLQVGDLPVFLAGDANGELQLLHEAADDGHIAGRNSLAEQPVRYRRRTPLAIVFSEPGLARVGRGFAELESDEAAVGGVDFSRQGRVRMAERAEGMARIYADKATGKLLGAEMCAPAAEHMAHLLALAIERELTVHDMLAMPFYHPVLEEGLRTALRDVARQLTALEDVSDLAHCPEMGIDALE